MCEQNQHISQITSLTEDYEQRALDAFRQWYRQTRPTIRDAASHAYLIARETVSSLTPTQVILLLQEHPDWTHQKPPAILSNEVCFTAGEAVRRHLVPHLEEVIQHRGLQETIDPDA